MNSSLKVLMLEDSQTDAEIIRRQLVKENHHQFIFEQVDTRDKYLQQLEQFQPDLILADNALPQFDAAEALQILNSKKLHIPFILVTGTVSEEFAADIIKKGADDFILKDRLARLTASIDNALRNRQLEKEKQEAADKLKQSEEKYRTIMERVSDGFIALDKEWRYTYINTEAAEILRRSPEELLGKKVWDLFPESVNQSFYQATHDAMIKQTYESAIDYLPHFNRCLENHIYPSPDGLSIFFRDITDRINTEKIIKASEIKYRTLVDQAFDGIVIYSPDGIIQECNHSASLNTGFPEEELKGMSVNGLFATEELQLHPIILDALKAGKVTRDHRRLKRKDGSLREMEIVTKMTPEGNMLAVGRDITDRIIAEEELKKNYAEKQLLANRLSIILNTLPANIALLDSDGNIIDINKEWQNLESDKGFIGRSTQIGENYITAIQKDKAYASEDGKKIATGIKAVLKNTKKEFIREYKCHCHIDCCPIWYRVVVTPLRDREKGGAVVMHMDISELKKLEQERIQLKEEEQKKITLAMLQGQEKERNALGIELHDNVNQILVGTNVLLSVIKEFPEKGPTLVANCIDNIKTAIAENRKLAHELVSPDMHTESLLEQFKRLLNNMLRPAGIQTELKSNDFTEQLLNDSQKLALYRVAQEQCSNVVKYSKAKKVVLWLSTLDKKLLMRITDDGVGMDMNKATKGIGLKNITSRLSVLSGKMNIESSPGQGFSMEVEIPLPAETLMKSA